MRRRTALAANANFFNQENAVAQALFGRADCLPVHFRRMQGRMVVTRNLSDDGGLAPDVWAAPTIADVAAGHDPVRQVAQALAARA